MGRKSRCSGWEEDTSLLVRRAGACEREDGAGTPLFDARPRGRKPSGFWEIWASLSSRAIKARHGGGASGETGSPCLLCFLKLTTSFFSTFILEGQCLGKYQHLWLLETVRSKVKIPAFLPLPPLSVYPALASLPSLSCPGCSRVGSFVIYHSCDSCNIFTFKSYWHHELYLSSIKRERRSVPV